MLAVGRVNRLKIERITSSGAYFATEEGDILLPGKYLPDSAQPGEWMEVFICLDSEDRLIATTDTPKAMVGDVALLRVVDTNNVGAFLDWGLEKDLLVPFSEQPQRMRKGETHLVRVYLDNTGRIAASAIIGKFLEETNATLRVGEEVELIPYEFTDLGAKVAINGRYTGVLFRNELYGGQEAGERLTGYVKRIRDDGKIDVTLRREGSKELADDRNKIMKALTARGGFLPLNDKSSPEMIAELLRMSKKSFKKAVGGLYKDGFVVLTPEGLKLRQK